MTDGPTDREQGGGRPIGPKPSIAQVAAWLRRAAEDGEGIEDLSSTTEPGPAAGGPAGEHGVSHEPPPGLGPEAGEGRDAAPADSATEETKDEQAAAAEPASSPPPSGDREPAPPAAETASEAAASPGPATAIWALPAPDDGPTEPPGSEPDGPRAQEDSSAHEAGGLAAATASPISHEPAEAEEAPAEAEGVSTPPPPPAEPVRQLWDLGTAVGTGKGLPPTDPWMTRPAGPSGGSPREPLGAGETAAEAAASAASEAPEALNAQGAEKPVGAAVTSTSHVTDAAAPGDSEDEPTDPQPVSPAAGTASLFDLDLAELAARARASAAIGGPVKGQPPRAARPIEAPAPIELEPVPDDAEPSQDPSSAPSPSPTAPVRQPLIAASTALDLSKETSTEPEAGDVELGDTPVADAPAEKAAPPRTFRLPRTFRSQRTHYPRGQLRERIGLLRRVRALLGVVVVTVLLGVAAGAAIGAFLLFLAFAVRGAITTG